MRRWMMFLIFLQARGAWAEEPGLPEVSGGIGLAPLVIRVILSLILVVVLIYGFVFVLVRMMDRRRSRGGEALIRMLGSIFLGPKKGVYLLHVLNRVLVVGVTDANIVLLSEITDPSIVQSASCVDNLPREDTFMDQLRSVMGRFRRTDEENQDEV